MKVKIYGTCPSSDPAEQAQFKRVTQIIVKASRSKCEWAFILRNFNYRHRAGERIEFDKDWNGQFDVVFMSEHKLILYELKAFTVDIRYGNTGPAKWRIRPLSSAKPILVRSYFQQVSKQRAFFLQDYLEHLRGTGHLELEDHFVVDARLVFKTGSNLNGFFYRPVMTIEEAAFNEEVLGSIECESDREFVKDVYSDREQGTGKLKRCRRSRDDYNRLKSIFLTQEIQNRTNKWFGLLTEDRIAKDLCSCGSDEFTIRREDALYIARDFGLEEETM